VNQAKNGDVVLKDSQPKRDFIYIVDVPQAYWNAIYYDLIGVEVFNLGSGVSTSIKELTEAVGKYFRNNFSVHFTEDQRKK
jgi:nucleoside-diphosphate-sugar epimerase